MTDTALIRSEPHVDIGAIIARDADALVERWCELALAEQASSVLVHEEVLRNQLHPLLQRMGEGLRQSGDGEPREHRAEALEHGEQRWDSRGGQPDSTPTSPSRWTSRRSVAC